MVDHLGMSLCVKFIVLHCEIFLSGVTNLACHLMVCHTHQGAKHRACLPLNALMSRTLPGVKLKDHLNTLTSLALPGAKLKDRLLRDSMSHAHLGVKLRARLHRGSTNHALLLPVKHSELHLISLLLVSNGQQLCHPISPGLHLDLAMSSSSRSSNSHHTLHLKLRPMLLPKLLSKANQDSRAHHLQVALQTLYI